MPLEETYKPTLRFTGRKGGPLRSLENHQVGFYNVGPIKDILADTEEDEDDFRVSALPIPRNGWEYKIVEQLARHPRICMAVVDKTKLMFLRVGNKKGWLSALKDAGFEVHGGPKTPKRAKQLYRPTLLNASFDDLNVYVADAQQYSDYDFSEQSTEVPDWMKNPEVYSRLCDGAFVVSTRLHQAMLRNIPVFNPQSSSDPLEYYYDGQLRSQMIKDLEKQYVYNARIIGKLGMIKGNMFVAELPEGIDVITTRENIKKEVSNSKRWYLIAEPQFAKKGTTTDIQTMINLPKLFRKSDMEFWISEEYKKMFAEVTEGRILSDYKRVYMRLWKDDQDDSRTIDDQELHSRLTYIGYRWVAMGLSITNSPWLFKTLAISHAKPLQKRIPVPCSLYEQVISESLARMAGWDGTVEQGSIRRCLDLGVHVVNDLDWLEMYESHGGHDADDFFKLYYRTIQGGEMNGQKVVVVNRCPNGYGEYSVFKYVEGEKFPVWKDSLGNEHSFPEVNGRRWPQRLSEAIRNGSVKYAGLPSENMESKIEYSPEYTVEDFLMNVRNAMSNGSVGGYVNTVMLHSLVLGKHRPVQLCSMEAAIDGCTQTDVIEDRVAIDMEAEKIFQEVIDSGRPIDSYYWYDRKFALRYPEADVELYEGKPTQFQMLCKSYFAEYAKKVSDWAQENARPVENVSVLGDRLVLHAQSDIRRFRKEIYLSNSMNASFTGSIGRDIWEQIYQKIAEHIDTFECEEDKHDYALALLHSSIKFPTAEGNVTDQIVMNRIVYPYLERALIFYGIGSVLKLHKNDRGKLYTEDIRVESWDYTDPEGVVHTFTDPVEFQNFHKIHSPIAHTAPALKDVKSDLRPLNIK